MSCALAPRPNPDILQHMARSILLFLAIVVASLPLAQGARPSMRQARAVGSEDVREIDELIKRLGDERFKEIQSGALWTLIHDYRDYGHIQSVLLTLQSYMERFEKYKGGDTSSLNQAGGVKQFKDQLAAWLDDDEQCVRAF